MKILSGKFKGKSLKTFSNPHVRPTCGIVKEAVFNICAGYIAGARFLDLFAGSGSMGFEAISRGAGSATFVDSSIEAVRLIRANLALLDANLPVHILKQDVCSALVRLGKQKCSFDIIYIDPPYALEDVFLQEVLALIVQKQLLELDGILFLENASSQDIIVKGLELRKRRKSGGTFLSEYCLRKETESEMSLS
ncbi:16S rRNA (guanine(966)-N(2))-methyltransferase RsmD [Chlamydia sp.]|uniref:16S rRNA (guanine(966)-N(2))-methyltransferase RsmD n=1 Tax=Chlamydia sp. TaxID=35827 RepID=UPI0025B854C1|nr:16S rRNA (guanine(966)-N(2))-methyltransferase RsmD [Chlamydia sp.]MBQ8498613.1 16S rRNA (guanine(966)-N(2))-methyltransferase RsmD [Chlamydia sp.]